MPFNQITIQDLTGLDYQPEDFILLSGTGVVPPPPTTTTTTVAYFVFAGSSLQQSTSTLACTNKTCARDFYRSAPTFANGQIVYDDNALTIPYNGGGNWIAIDTSMTFCSGTGWRAIQISNTGVILDSIACP
jgi:hypothetical protein